MVPNAQCVNDRTSTLNMWWSCRECSGGLWSMGKGRHHCREATCLWPEESPTTADWEARSIGYGNSQKACIPERVARDKKAPQAKVPISVDLHLFLFVLSCFFCQRHRLVILLLERAYAEMNIAFSIHLFSNEKEIAEGVDRFLSLKSCMSSNSDLDITVSQFLTRAYFNSL